MAIAAAIRPELEFIEEIKKHLEFKLSTECFQVAPVRFEVLSIISAYFLEKLNPTGALLLLPEESLARRLFRELTYLKEFWKFPHEVLWFCQLFSLPFSYAHPDPEKEGIRTRTLATLSEGKNAIVVTSVDAMTTRTIAKKKFRSHSLALKIQQRISQKELIDFLIKASYQRCEVTEKPGDFSVKGSIVDVYCPTYFNPLRFDFFGDELDSIRFFDPLSQKTIESCEQVSLYPVREILFSQEELKTLENLLAQKPKKNPPPFLLSPGSESQGIYDVFPLVLETDSLFAYLPQDFSLFVYDKEKCSQRFEQLLRERQFLFEKNQENLVAPMDKLFLSWQEVEALYPKKKYFFSSLPQNLNEKNPQVASVPNFRGRISQLVDFLLSEQVKNKKIFFSLTSEVQKERLEHILSAYQELPEHHYFLSPLEGGFCAENFILLCEAEIFGKKSRSLAIHKTTTQIIESFVELKEGDIVVHVNYGLARFVGLKRMKVAGSERDFLELEFAENARLYVPLDQLKLIHRYIGSVENPKLDYLGKKSQWEKTKQRVKENVSKLAMELLELYAQREKARGYAFPPDTTFQEEFEASFPYEETEHQLMAILDVKRDMESERPMDRLICGDVGFGKTEVAIRAAFKAVMAGKQVAILCPTTILAFQHYQTFKERFRNYPVNIDYLSRFRSESEIKDIKERLSVGKIDIIIGTHALLSKTIRFKNLGLLIIDEEQRFGVAHKEAIKKLKHNLDCLTLTATPIPRTLHMSLVGIRDLSIIETPPRNRQKIETYVLEENEEILRQAILHELERKGQVYVLHNKVKTIEAQANRIRQIIPQARIAILHGQMLEEQIEQTMLDFYQGHYDILVTTTIIESGIDIPNVNTLIVMNAQDFGLSQLYQLKGRVGRSERQAYAYFFYPRGLSINEVAMKRLNTLQEYDELGSGFKIAMRDLEIRGAGNILGKEQSGDIMEVGFELYLDMLQEKLRELKEQKLEKKEELICQMNIRQDFYFPNSYIRDTRQKMEFYKKLVGLQTIAEWEALWDELLDRFGEPPAQVEAIFLQERLRILGTFLGLEKIEGDEERFTFTAGPECRIPANKIVELLNKDSRFKLDPQDFRQLHFFAGVNLHTLRELNLLLDSWAQNIEIS